MATITASINLTSDITEYGFGITKTMTMTKAGTTVGIENTNGLGVKNLSATTAVVLELAADATASVANKVYIRNTSSNKAEHVKISLHASASADTTVQIIGRLYGGDWMLIPWEANGTGHNIVAAPSTADEVTTIEYMTFHEVA
tara:strand:+ start:212 stop:643 length:432 start_codon:yes stop_codon:yes gene_type:complete